MGLLHADFFIDFVDYEHCIRLRRHGFKIAVVRDSPLAWYVFFLLLFGKRKLACLGKMCRGFLDGRVGRLGIRFQGA